MMWTHLLGLRRMTTAFDAPLARRICNRASDLGSVQTTGKSGAVVVSLILFTGGEWAISDGFLFEDVPLGVEHAHSMLAVAKVDLEGDGRGGC
jgi:hypothetical protein